MVSWSCGWCYDERDLMPQTRAAISDALTLDAVIDRLQQQPTVEGLILVGSAANATMNVASDYDLVLILSAMPVPLHTGVTSIDGRFTDLLFHTTADVEQILAATAAFDFGDWTGRLVGWLLEGQIRFDQRGQLGAAQAKVRAGEWILPVAARTAYSAWQRINYNLAVVRRLLRSDDPTYLMAAEMRMALFGPQDLFWNYFAVRGLHPESEKAEIAYLREHDPEFLRHFNRFLSTTDREAKVRQYEELAAWVLRPVGKLWPPSHTVLNLTGAAVTPETERQALDFWATLIGEP